MTDFCTKNFCVGMTFFKHLLWLQIYIYMYYNKINDWVGTSFVKNPERTKKIINFYKNLILVLRFIIVRYLKKRQLNLFKDNMIQGMHVLSLCQSGNFYEYINKGKARSTFWHVYLTYMYDHVLVGICVSKMYYC